MHCLSVFVGQVFLGAFNFLKSGIDKLLGLNQVAGHLENVFANVNVLGDVYLVPLLP